MESPFQAIYSDVVRIDSDSSNDGSWLEIDAIKISGGKGGLEPEPEPEPEPYPKQLYASRVKSFSSEWTNSQ